MTVVFNGEFEKKPRKEVAEAVDDFEWAFDERGATRCEIPPGTKRIAPCAFADCKALATVEFPEGLTEIGEEAFRSCYSLKALALPASRRWFLIR